MHPWTDGASFLGFRVVTCAVADRARRIDAGHEKEFDKHEAFSQAIFASPLGHPGGAAWAEAATSMSASEETSSLRIFMGAPGAERGEFGL